MSVFFIYNTKVIHKYTHIAENSKERMQRKTLVIQFYHYNQIYLLHNTLYETN